MLEIIGRREVITEIICLNREINTQDTSDRQELANLLKCHVDVIMKLQHGYSQEIDGVVYNGYEVTYLKR